MDKYDTLEYFWVKAIEVSMHLRIYLCVFKNTNKVSGAIANVVITSFSRITPVLLNYGIR